MCVIFNFTHHLREFRVGHAGFGVVFPKTYTDPTMFRICEMKSFEPEILQDFQTRHSYSYTCMYKCIHTYPYWKTCLWQNWCHIPDRISSYGAYGVVIAVRGAHC